MILLKRPRNQSPPETTHEILCDYCHQLIATYKGAFGKKLPIKEEDHLGFMLATWGLMQLEHLHGVGYLVSNQCFAQAGILARTMLEGKRPENRTFLSRCSLASMTPFREARGVMHGEEIGAR